MCVGALHRNFFKHLETNPIVLFAKALDLRIGTGFLLAEVIGWKSQNGHLFSILFMQFLQIRILWCKAALGSNIDNQHILPFEL